MRFDRFEIDAFGPLTALKAEGLAAHPVLVVHGENETGKTCLREFLATLLYGFSPASRGGHPWSPWSGAAPEGRAVLRLQDGRALRIERRLRELPEGRAASDEGAPAELGNRPLPATGPVDRSLFEDVHAPGGDLSDGLSAAAWAAVRERLLAGIEAPHLRTAREAAIALEARAAELWQPDRRARTRHRALSIRIRRLTRDRERAAAELRRLLELRGLVAARTWHLRGMEEQLAETRARLLRAERVLPVMRGLQAAAELRRRSHAAVPNDDFGSEPGATLAAARAAAAAAAERSAAAAAGISGHETRTRLSAEDSTLLAAEDEIRALVGEAAVHQQDVVHINDLARQRDAQEALFRERGTHLFSEPLSPAGRETLARLGVGELRDRVHAWEEAALGPEAARQEVRQAKERLRVCELDFEAVPSADTERKLRAREELLRQLQAREDAWQALKKDVEAAHAAREAAAKKLRRPRGRSSQALGLFIAAGCTLGTLLLGSGEAWWMVVPIAAWLIWSGWKTLRYKPTTPVLPDEQRAEAIHQECLKLREQLGLHEVEIVGGPLDKAREALSHVAERPELERRLVAARQHAEDCGRIVAVREQDCDKARRHVGEWLASLPVLPARLEQPGQDLLADIDDLRATLREMTRLTGEREAVAQRAREREARAARVAERLEIMTSRSPMDASAIWFERLQLALAARRRADESTRALPALREQAAALGAAAAAAREAQQAAESRLGALDPSGRAEAGLAALLAARGWLVEADEAEAALRRQFPDWQERAAEAQAAEAAGETLDLTTGQRVALTGQIAKLGESMQAVQAELAGLVAERDALLRRRPLSDIDGALAALNADRTRIERLRDRLATLAALIRLADARWRERWQAPVLKAASVHLAALTGGRWDRLDAETGADGTRIYVKRWDGETLRELAEPLSRTVREQAWLALRVALAESLDGDEPLPLVLDDPFDGWDAARVKSAAALLAGIGTHRQVVVLTGRSTVADTFESAVKARVLRLSPPASPPAPSKSRRKDESRTEAARAEEPRRTEEHPRAGV